MIYELTIDGYTLGQFLTEAEAIRRARYLPRGRYTLREWARDGEFSTFDPSTNKHYDFMNYDRKSEAETNIKALAALIREYVTTNCDGVDEETGLYLCRSAADAPEIDGNVCVSSEMPLYPGEFYDILIEESDLYDLYGVPVESAE